MQPKDKAEFLALLTSIGALYRVDLSRGVIDLWWNGMQQYDLATVRAALTAHAMNPDVGQFMPKPADVVRAIGGTTTDAALIAWAKVHRAIRLVGGWLDVVFDDPLIHAVVADMGGWVNLCGISDEELPFRAKEFENRYRAYSRAKEAPSFVPVLTGRANTYNAAHGQPLDAPRLVGDPEKCEAIMAADCVPAIGAPAVLEAATRLKRIK